MKLLCQVIGASVVGGILGFIFGIGLMEVFEMIGGMFK